MERTPKSNVFPRPRRLVGLIALSVLGSLVAWRFVAGRQPRAGEPRVLASERQPAVADAGGRGAEPAPALLSDPVEVRRDHAEAATETKLAHAALTQGSVPKATETSERTIVVGRAARPLRGRVLDETTGRGLGECEVFLTAPSGSSSTLTAEDGAFRFELEPPQTRTVPFSCSLEVIPAEGWAVREPARVLDRAALDAGFEPVFHARRWPPLETGRVRGRLIAEDGEFDERALLPRGALLLELTSMETPRIRLAAELERVEADDGPTHTPFSFEDVPITTYELTLSSLGNFRWEPGSQIIVPPAEGLEFLRFDLDERVPLEFRVIDAATGEAIEGFRVRTVRATESRDNGVLLHTGPLDPEGFPLEGAFCWTIDADGYAPAFGSDADFVLEDGKRVAQVAMHPGWATRFVVMGGKPNTRLLEGAEVVLDGRTVGRTGPDGALVVRLDEPPESVEVRYLGWRLANDPLGATQGRTAESRGNVTVALLEE